nr:unnamed protein product [Naegleria fowleri]
MLRRATLWLSKPPQPIVYYQKRLFSTHLSHVFSATGPQNNEGHFQPDVISKNLPTQVNTSINPCSSTQHVSSVEEISFEKITTSNVHEESTKEPTRTENAPMYSVEKKDAVATSPCSKTTTDHDRSSNENSNTTHNDTSMSSTSKITLHEKKDEEKTPQNNMIDQPFDQHQATTKPAVEHVSNSEMMKNPHSAQHHDSTRYYEEKKQESMNSNQVNTNPEAHQENHSFKEGPRKRIWTWLIAILICVLPMISIDHYKLYDTHYIDIIITFEYVLMSLVLTMVFLSFKTSKEIYKAIAAATGGAIGISFFNHTQFRIDISRQHIHSILKNEIDQVQKLKHDFF